MKEPPPLLNPVHFEPSDDGYGLSLPEWVKTIVEAAVFFGIIVLGLAIVSQP